MKHGGYIILSGTFEDGHRFIGPFPTSQDAVTYATTHMLGAWELIQLELPHGDQDIQTG